MMHTKIRSNMVAIKWEPFPCNFLMLRCNFKFEQYNYFQLVESRYIYIYFWGKGWNFSYVHKFFLFLYTYALRCFVVALLWRCASLSLSHGYFVKLLSQIHVIFLSHFDICYFDRSYQALPTVGRLLLHLTRATVHLQTPGYKCR